jgi:hypothetical protein
MNTHLRARGYVIFWTVRDDRENIFRLNSHYYATDYTEKSFRNDAGAAPRARPADHAKDRDYSLRSEMTGVLILGVILNGVREVKNPGILPWRSQ